MSNTINTLIIDDHPLFRKGVIQLLGMEPDFNVIAEAASGAEGVALALEHNPDLIASLKLTTALGGRTVSLQERQVEVLRDKIRQLELKLASLTRNAGSNDVIMSNFHQWILRLLSDNDGKDLPASLLDAMKESFNVPEATLRLWNAKSEYADEWFIVDDEDIRAFADAQQQPLCGPAADKIGRAHV